MVLTLHREDLRSFWDLKLNYKGSVTPGICECLNVHLCAVTRVIRPEKKKTQWNNRTAYSVVYGGDRTKTFKGLRVKRQTNPQTTEQASR